MSTKYTREVIAGAAVACDVARLRALTVRPSKWRDGTLDSESLCEFQRKANTAGYLEAEIVESNYGYSLRYASGLQNCGLIKSSRHREIDGTFQGAVEAARVWVAADPAKRYVTFMLCAERAEP